jgi:hypothetical protein
VRNEHWRLCRRLAPLSGFRSIAENPAAYFRSLPIVKIPTRVLTALPKSSPLSLGPARGIARFSDLTLQTKPDSQRVP